MCDPPKKGQKERKKEKHQDKVCAGQTRIMKLD